MRAEQGRRAGRVAVLVTTMLLPLGACAREPILPLCEGALYAGQANQLAAEAIDAASTTDTATLAAKLGAARANLDQADRRLAEVLSSEESDGWQEWIDAFGQALGQTRSVLDALSESPPPPSSLLREQLGSAASTLTTIGPAADCADIHVQPSD